MLYPSKGLTNMCPLYRKTYLRNDDKVLNSILLITLISIYYPQVTPSDKRVIGIHLL